MPAVQVGNDEVAREKVFPFQYLEWDIVDQGVNLFITVTWLEDWGPFKKGEISDSITIDDSEGTLEEYSDKERRAVRGVRFTALAGEEYEPPRPVNGNAEGEDDPD